MEKIYKEVQAMFNYSRQHTDELSFQKGDIIKIKVELEGGWWQGELNGSTGWFPSNYVAEISNYDSSPEIVERGHLQSFQQEIVQHILEGEAKQIADLTNTIKMLKPIIEKCSLIPSLSKLPIFIDKIKSIIQLHDWLAKSLETMKPISKKKAVGQLFLDIAAIMSSVVCEYIKCYAHVYAGLEENKTLIVNSIGAAGNEVFSKRAGNLMQSVFDRLSRYPILLKETERYYEDPHPDRPAILQAVKVYSEIIEQCSLLRKLKEADVAILSSEIRGLTESLLQFGDPTLTLCVICCIANPSNSEAGAKMCLIADPAETPAVLVVFSSSIVLLSSCPDSPSSFQFRTRVLLKNLSVTSSSENDTILSFQLSGNGDFGDEGVLNLSCCDKATRDLLFSTINELIDAQSNTMKTSASQSIPGQTDLIIDVEKLKSSGTKQITKMASSMESVQKEAASRHARDDKTNPDSIVVRRSGSTRSASGCDAVLLMPSYSPTLRPAYSGPIASTVDIQQAVEAGRSDAITTTKMAVRDLTDLPGCRFLPHGINMAPHVKWPEDMLALSSRQNGNEAARSPPVSPSASGGALLSLRLDATSQWMRSPGGGRAGSAIGVSNAANDSGSRQSRAAFTGPPPSLFRHSRATSPKSNLVRRKRSDRQKSAINPDDVLRSAGRLHEMNQRSESDAMILQVIESYCASGLSKSAVKPLDLSKLHLGVSEIRQKDSSLFLLQSTNRISGCHAYENTSGLGEICPQSHEIGLDSNPLRPPPVILPTRGERKT